MRLGTFYSKPSDGQRDSQYILTDRRTDEGLKEIASSNGHGSGLEVKDELEPVKNSI
jgi:hypothetical protein